MNKNYIFHYNKNEYFTNNINNDRFYYFTQLSNIIQGGKKVSRHLIIIVNTMPIQPNRGLYLSHSDQWENVETIWCTKGHLLW